MCIIFLSVQCFWHIFHFIYWLVGSCGCYSCCAMTATKHESEYEMCKRFPSLQSTSQLVVCNWNCSVHFFTSIFVMASKKRKMRIWIWQKKKKKKYTQTTTTHFYINHRSCTIITFGAMCIGHAVRQWYWFTRTAEHSKCTCDRFVHNAVNKTSNRIDCDELR